MSCSVKDCERTGQTRRGLCELHYDRLRRSPGFKPLPIPTSAERLTAGLERKPNGCLEWTGGTNEHGYGHVGISGKSFYTHRIAWELANGPIPDGLHVLHHCDNPPCCDTSPSEEYPEGHLFLGTNADNNADMMAKGRFVNWESAITHCPQGHAYDEANTYVSSGGSRLCRACTRIRTLAYYHSKKATSKETS